MIPLDVTLQQSLEGDGFAAVPLLDRAACEAIAAQWHDPVFRKAVVMARHNFGKGEYRYYADPLPDPVAGLRAAWYERLAPIASAWAELWGSEPFPASHEELRTRSLDAGQGLPTPLLLRYEAGDYNCLHQDLYGPLVFPLQVIVLLSRPGEDFDGGELVLVEQRPRVQSRARVIPLRQGEAAIIPSFQRPRRTPRGTHRVTVRHGVSEIRRGRRFALGIPFHDAPR